MNFLTGNDGDEPGDGPSIVGFVIFAGVMVAVIAAIPYIVKAVEIAYAPQLVRGAR
jgi:hypothetical protein